MAEPLSPREALIAYLKIKVEEADWHGVSDAANDLRVMEARYPPVLRSSEAQFAVGARPPGAK